jgi:SAM-dependent methyltransferase
MTRTATPKRDPARRNRDLYARPEVVQEYVRLLGFQFESERRILASLGDAIRGKRILDLGVGAGRTTHWLLAYSSYYLGVDFSREMIERCRTRFPGVSFREHDARHLDSLSAEPFDLVFFSFNGIDCVDHQDRAMVLRGAFAKLAPGGRFLFSSHNLRVPECRPWNLDLYDWRGGWRQTARGARQLLRNSFNLAFSRRYEARGDGYAILVDTGHDFRCPHYYVDPPHQVAALERAGFTEVTLFDFHGDPRRRDSPELLESAHVHYLARRAE